MLKWISKFAVGALSRYSLDIGLEGGTEENLKRKTSRWFMTCPRFETRISSIIVEN
jgi:hypothetical protein